MEKLYNKTAMTYNVHQLLHLAESIANWGPLWAHSAYCFESANYILLNAIKCAKGVKEQILRFIHKQTYHSKGDIFTSLVVYRMGKFLGK